MAISYVSTRGHAPELNFEDVVLAGLASDGGLYVPNHLPIYSAAEIAALAGMPYPELAARLLEPFTQGCIGGAELRALLEESYANFRHAAVAPLTQLSADHFLLELFHGPTLAFKDFALQFLGRLLDHILKKRGERVTIVGATSGDTGSAAIDGCRGRDNIRIFILHPKGRVSDVQRRQMTTIADKNVHNIALEGTFDDCQDIVKALFADAEFREQQKLAAVNSINWARILAQTVYYFYAATALGAPHRKISFSVPTGNFGDIYAGYIAKRMGLPVDRLVIATNRNDILTRTLATGSYQTAGVVPTISPSMDIQVSSNFERLLFDLHGRDGNVISGMMRSFRETGTLTLAPNVLASLRAEFSAHASDDAATKATMRTIHAETGLLVDPHTATGVNAANALQPHDGTPFITLATAHPAKFPDAAYAATGVHPHLPEHLSDLMKRAEHFAVVENNVADVRRFIEKTS